MSPHFESQPEKPVFVPKSAWHAAPAAPADTSAVSINSQQEAKNIVPKE
jgi:hypothetical protein